MEGAGESTENVLERVLVQDIAFSPPPSRRQSALIENLAPPAPSSSVASGAVSPSPSEDLLSESTTSDASWKEAYDSQVKVWRTQSAEARAKAERERERWEAIRAAEKLQGSAQSRSVDESGWETVGRKQGAEDAPAALAQAGPASSATNSEKQPLCPRNAPLTANPSSEHSRQDTGDESQKWEDVPSSVTSSFPSMSFPDNIEASAHEAQPPPAPRSVTLSVFDSSLSAGTRVKALLSSLAINLLLPFVNGVMLGFGEIFAKNVVLGWFGWKTSPTVASVGLRRKPPL